MRHTGKTLACLIIVGSRVNANRAWAADVPPGPAQVGLAEARFREGERLFDEKDYVAACAAFDESERLDPQLGTLLNLAFCQETLGKTATAWREYNAGAVWAGQRGPPGRQAWALARALEVGKRLPQVMLCLPPSAKAYTIEIDGGTVPPAELGLPLFLDPGLHLVRVSAAGHRTAQVTVQVAEGPTSQNVSVPALDAEVEADGTVTARKDGRMVVAVFALGVGVAALGVGTYFGVRAFTKKDDANAHCAGALCDDTGNALQDDSNRSAAVSVAAIGAGVVSLGVGAWLALNVAAPRPRSVSATLRPLLGRVTGIGVEGRW